MGPHSVVLLDDGTLDTVLSVNGREYRYSDVDRSEKCWLLDLKDTAIQDFEDEQSEHNYNPIGPLDNPKCVECGLSGKYHF